MEEITLKSLMISLIIVFIGGLIQGYTGFGGGTISVPILVLLFGPIAAIGIITPIYIFGALAILPKAIKNVNWSEVLPVSIAGSIAVFVGLSILVNTNPLVIKNIMGFFILLTTLIMIAARKYNGAIFLGLNGPVVKSHGGTDALGFYYSIDLCYKIVKGNLMDQIRRNLSHLESDKD